MNKRLKAFAAVVLVGVAGGALAAMVAGLIYAIGAAQGELKATVIVGVIVGLALAAMAYFATNEGADE